MKTIPPSFLCLMMLFISSCGYEESPLKEGHAEVVINTTTRGGYQFIIRFNNELYYPENLPEEYKVVTQEPIPVYVKFKLLDFQKDLLRPAPNDVPIFYKAIPAIHLITINKP